jgi:hypothetical protein
VPGAVADETTTVRSTFNDLSEWMTCITMPRPQITCSGFKRWKVYP